MKQLLHKKSFDRVVKSEDKASTHINIVAHYSDDTLIDKNGSLIKIIELKGIDFVTQSELALDTFKHRRNTLLKSFSSEFAIYSWTVRKK